MAPALVVLEPHYRGDTWRGLEIGPVQFNTGTVAVPVLVDPPFPLVSCRMQFRDSDDVCFYELSSEVLEGNGTITIADDVSWTITIPPQLLPLESKTWKYDLECVDSDGTVITIYYGTMVVTSDITR
jgi:hypothetical protein